MDRRTFLKMGPALLAAASLYRPPEAVAAATVAPRSAAAHAATRPPRFGDGRDWWFQRRFGLFLHWGLYAINGFHEQEQWRRRVPRAEYVKLARRWNPTKFDPDAWLDLAGEAGMSYVCFTTKHHDGFCLWDTKLTRYNTMNTPHGRDIVGQLAEACHRRNVPLCLYYSIADWHHPNYPTQGRHHELPPQPGDAPDYVKYLDYVRGQVRELCTRYGEIHGFWWDMNVDEHVDASFNQTIRELQPNAVINDRGFDQGDFGTPERVEKTGEELRVFTRRTEACQSVGAESWGWREDEDYYADRHLLRSIDRYLARDANYLLNVGPKPDGTISERCAAILRRIGAWHRVAREALTDTEPGSHLVENRNVLVTRRGQTLYVHLSELPISEAVKLNPIAVAPQRATLLNTGEPVSWSLDFLPSEHVSQQRFLRLVRLPVQRLVNTIPIVKLEFGGDVQLAR